MTVTDFWWREKMQCLHALLFWEKCTSEMNSKSLNYLFRRNFGKSKPLKKLFLVRFQDLGWSWSVNWKGEIATDWDRHAGTVQHGFFEGAQLMFQPRSTADYHHEMNSDVFWEWIHDLLRGLEEPSVFEMDNASYDSNHLEIIPSWKTPKFDIIALLESKILCTIQTILLWSY